MEHDEHSDDGSRATGRNLYWEMHGRNSAAVQSGSLLESLEQNTAAETAHLRALTGLIAKNNEERARLASVIVPAQPQVASDPLPRALQEAEPARVAPPTPRPMTREVADQIAEAASARRKHYAGGRS